MQVTSDVDIAMHCCSCHLESCSDHHHAKSLPPSYTKYSRSPQCSLGFALLSPSLALPSLCKQSSGSRRGTCLVTVEGL